MALLLYALGAAVAVFVLRRLLAYRSLTEFRGPWSCGFSRFWYIRASMSGEMHLRFQAVNAKYGGCHTIAIGLSL